MGYPGSSSVMREMINDLFSQLRRILEEKGYNTAFIYKRNFEIHIALGSFKEVLF